MKYMLIIVFVPIMSTQTQPNSLTTGELLLMVGSPNLPSSYHFKIAFEHVVIVILHANIVFLVHQ